MPPNNVRNCPFIKEKEGAVSMKIIIAPDSFKESMTAQQAADAIEAGFKEVYPNATYIKVPMADGGEGTVQSLVDATNGRIITRKVTGPLGQEVEAFFGISGDNKTAFIEMAAASGLHLVPVEKRNPLITTTRGTGELIVEAIDLGAKHIIIGIGGSATNDGGAGMAEALGVKLLTEKGEEVAPGGGDLREISTIDLSNLDPRVSDVKIEVACDVDNPLTGERGSSAIFGPQKGATPEMVKVLDENLAHFAEKIASYTGKQINDLEGSGAAGGLGGGLVAFLSAKLKKGVEIVLDAVKLEEKVKNADLIITGEGKIDAQTIYGKTPIGVARIAKKYDVPVIGLGGAVGDDHHAVLDHGIDAIFSIVNGAISLEEALQKGQKNLTLTSKNVAKLLQVTMKLQL
jgi:glycerate kinase